MNWRIDTSKNAEKFLEQNNLAKEEVGGKIRFIAEFDFENSVVLVEEIDWRGNVYK